MVSNLGTSPTFFWGGGGGGGEVISVWPMYYMQALSSAF